MFVEFGLVHTDSMPLTRLGLLELTRGGVPWVGNPTRRTFLLPDPRGPFFGVIVEAGTPRLTPHAELLGSADTARLAAALEGRDDVVMIGSRVRYEVCDRTRKDRGVHEIAGARDAEMKRNGHRLLELIDDAVRVSTCKGRTLDFGTWSAGSPRLRCGTRGLQGSWSGPASPTRPYFDGLERRVVEADRRETSSRNAPLQEPWRTRLPQARPSVLRWSVSQPPA